jgi:hypothetical protein
MSQTAQAKVLKIGIVVEEQLVQERVIDASATVTLGGGARSTFQAEKTGLPGEEFPLFVWREGKYWIRFVPGVKGKLTSEGEKKSLERVVKEAGAAKDGDAWWLPLNEEDKGKVEAGAVTVLFRFVEAPPPPAPVTPDVFDFRPRLVEDDDPIFFGWLAIGTAMALVFGVWVSNAERPEIRFEDLPDRFTRIELPPMETKSEPTPTELVESDNGKAAKEDDAAKPEEAKPQDDKRTNDKVQSAKAVDSAKKNIAQSSALFQALQAQMLGTLGSTSRGTVLLENASGQFDDLSGKLSQVAESGAYVGDGSRIRGGAGVVGGTGDKTIGDLSKGIDGGTGGSTDLGKAPEVKVRGGVSADSLDFDGGDTTNVKKVVAANKGKLVYCHEQSLKLNPKVAGKLIIGWTVSGGAASDVHVVDNTTDDKDLESCVVSAIRRWKFTDVPDGDVKNTFVFQPKAE